MKSVISVDCSIRSVKSIGNKTGFSVKSEMKSICVASTE